jgi:hypothetical protein
MRCCAVTSDARQAIAARRTIAEPETGLVAEVTWGQRRADALGRLAEVALSADLDAGHAGDRYQAVLHVEAAASGDAEASVDVGRKTRTISTAIRRALSARDTRCQFPGCSARRCDAHHIDHWMDGGPTSLDNNLAGGTRANLVRLRA